MVAKWYAFGPYQLSTFLYYTGTSYSECLSGTRYLACSMASSKGSEDESTGGTNNRFENNVSIFNMEGNPVSPVWQNIEASEDEGGVNEGDQEQNIDEENGDGLESSPLKAASGHSPVELGNNWQFVEDKDLENAKVEHFRAEQMVPGSKKCQEPWTEGHQRIQRHPRTSVRQQRRYQIANQIVSTDQK